MKEYIYWKYAIFTQEMMDKFGKEECDKLAEKLLENAPIQFAENELE